MAMAAAPFGFRPVGRHGPKYVRAELKAVTRSNAIYQGQPIYTAGDGFVACVTDTAANQTGLIGIAAEYVSTTDTRTHVLCWDIDQDFEVQSNATGDNWTLADIGQTYEATLSTAADTTNMRSKASLDDVTSGGDESWQLKGYATIPNNSYGATATDVYPVCIVRCLPADQFGGAEI